jgi:hypothetical protein
MPRKKEVMRENEELRAKLETVESMLIDTDLARYAALEGLARVTPLSAEGLKDLAERQPLWSVSLGMSDGEPSKIYSRDLGDLDPELAAQQDTYLRFCDPEHFDRELLDFFDDCFYGSGDFYGDGQGGFKGGRFTIRVPATDELGLTMYDAHRVEIAEQYLQTTNFGSQSLHEALTA